MARFFKFHEEDLDKTRSFTAGEWRLFTYLRLIDPYGETYHDLNTLDILAECDIKKTTFYKAIAKFQELELFDFQDKGFSFRTLDFSEEAEEFPKKRKGFRKNGKVSEKTENDSEKTEPSLYKEFKTLSDCPEARESEKPEGPDNPDNVAIAVGVVTEVSQVSTVKPINSDEDKFSGARTGKTVQQRAFNWLPDGPWNLDGKLDPNFRDWLAGKWIADYGKDIHTQRANVLSHFKKDPANLPIRWEQYQGEFLDRVQNTKILLDNGIEIPEEYQDRLISHQRAITQSLPQEMNPIAELPNATVEPLPLTQGVQSVELPGTPQAIAYVPIPENGENWQAYKLFKPKPVEGAPITPEQWEATRKKLAALTGKFSFGKPTPKPLDNSLESLNQQLHDPALREAAIAFAKNSEIFKYCPDSNEIITCEEF